MYFRLYINEKTTILLSPKMHENNAFAGISSKWATITGALLHEETGDLIPVAKELNLRA